MLAIKNVVFFFSVIISFFFPSDRTLFIVLVASFATCFCDFYEYRNYVLNPEKRGKVAATYLGAFSFFCMLLCVVASSCYYVVPITVNDITSTIIEFTSHSDPPKFVFFIDYFIFAAIVTSIMVFNMIAVAALRAKESLMSRTQVGKQSFQDLVDQHQS